MLSLAFIFAGEKKEDGYVLIILVETFPGNIHQRMKFGKGLLYIYLRLTAAGEV